MYQHQQKPNFMKETTVILFIFFLFLGCKNPHIKKDFSDKIQELVLSENKIGQEYKFNIKQNRGLLEYSLVYIGGLKMKNDSIKFLWKTILSGNDSPQANCWICIYNNNGEKLGTYYVGGDSYELPKIKNKTLIFDYIIGCNQTTTISFKDSIPKEIFINCTEKGGDIYSFQTN